MSYEAMPNMSQGQLITEAMMDHIRENIEFLAGLEAFGEALSDVDDNSEIGGARIVTGSYDGDDTTSREIMGVGFQPILVGIWYASNINLRGFTADMTLPSSYFDSIDEDGFTVSYPTWNDSTYTYYWIAIG